MSGKKADDGARALSGKEKKEFDNVVRCYETKQHKKGLKSADFVLKKFPNHGETLAMKGLILSNMDRMEAGLAPLGSDGKSMNLHHMTQTQDGAIAEVTSTFHSENSSIIHINDNSIPSGIDREAFDKWRSDYWKSRANDFIED